MFSDRFRALKILAALAALVWLGLLAMDRLPRQCRYLGDAVRHPELCDGATVLVGQTIVEGIVDGGFLFRTSQGMVFAPDPEHRAKPGDMADILGRFASPATFEAQAVHVHLSRPVKIWVSLAAAAIVFVLLIAAFARPGD